MPEIFFKGPAQHLCYSKGAGCQRHKSFRVILYFVHQKFLSLTPYGFSMELCLLTCAEAVTLGNKRVEKIYSLVLSNFG